MSTIEIIKNLEAKTPMDELQKQAAIHALNGNFVEAIKLMMEITKDTPAGHQWLTRTAWFARVPGNEIGNGFLWRRLATVGLNGRPAAVILTGCFGFAVQEMRDLEREAHAHLEWGTWSWSWAALLPEEPPSFPE